MKYIILVLLLIGLGCVVLIDDDNDRTPIEQVYSSSVQSNSEFADTNPNPLSLVSQPMDLDKLTHSEPLSQQTDLKKTVVIQHQTQSEQTDEIGGYYDVSAMAPEDESAQVHYSTPIGKENLNPVAPEAGHELMPSGDALPMRSSPIDNIAPELLANPEISNVFNQIKPTQKINSDKN